MLSGGEWPCRAPAQSSLQGPGVLTLVLNMHTLCTDIHKHMVEHANTQVHSAKHKQF